MDKGVIIRSASSFGMPEWVRITVGTGEELDFFEAMFDEVRNDFEGATG